MPKRIVFFGEGGVSDPVRFGQYVRHLERREYSVKMVQLPNDTYDIRTYQYEGYDVVVAERPHHALLLKSYKEHGAKIIVDMDDDFWGIPPEHVGYKAVGRGNPQTLQFMEDCLGMADCLTVSTPEMALRLADFHKPIHILPNGWDDYNPKWYQKDIDPGFPVVGWAGTVTHREDFQPALKALQRIAKVSDVGVLIGGDPEVYRMFRSVPEDRRYFLPMLPYITYPAIFRRLKIWLAPLRNTYFNRAKSEIKLIEAGAAIKPWVASTLPFYKDWGCGGLFADTTDEYYEAIGKLVESPSLRRELSSQGNDKALERRASLLVENWIKVFEGL